MTEVARAARVAAGSVGPLVALVLVAVWAWAPPIGIVAQGALIGSLTALLAVGLALVYRANRVVNFAQGDLGVAPALLAIFVLAGDAPGGAPDFMTGLPYPVAFAAGLAGAILLGFLVERLVINRFSRAPRLVLTVATIGVAQVLTALALFMPKWFGFTATSLPALDPPFDAAFSVGNVNFDENDLLVIVAVPLLLAALTVLLRFTRVGIAIRATAERADRASTLGVPIGRVQTIVWVITTVLAFFTVFLRAGMIAVPIGSALGVTVLIRALAAAVIGRMDDFPRIAGAAVGLGIVEQAIVYRTGSDVIVAPVTFVVIVVALVVNRRGRGSRVEDQAVSTWQAAREMRPVPAELRRLPEVRLPTFAGAIALAAFLLTLPLWLASSSLAIVVDIGIVAILGVSLVVLTGWAGHVSLGHMAFAAIGGAVGAWMTQTGEFDLVVALVVGGLAGAAAAVAVGLPAARAGGLTMAVATLALASAVLYWLVNPDVFEWVPRGRFPREAVLFAQTPFEITLTTQSSFYFLVLAILAASIAAASGLRRTRTGRVLIALRENPRAAEAFGVNALRSMLIAFAVSGFLAAVAGVVFVHHLHSVPNSVVGNPFAAEQSLRVFTTVVIGGLGSIPGAIIGASYVYSAQYFLPYEWQFLASGAGLLLVLLVVPGGIGAALVEARDGLLRWTARRRDLLVPSLVADRRVEPPAPDAAAPAMAAAVADAVERPEVEAVAELGQ